MRTYIIEAVPTFGTIDPRSHYRDRPGAYALIPGQTNGIAVVRTKAGLFLPGGGVESGESAEQALMRECIEECGLSIGIEASVGSAIQYIAVPGEGCFRLVGHFFIASIRGTTSLAAEAGHELIWMGAISAVKLMTREFERWAIERALDIHGGIAAND